MNGVVVTANATEEYRELRKILTEPTMMADHSGSAMEADAARPSSASSRVCTPPPPDMPCPTAENWCYTQVRTVTVCIYLTRQLVVQSLHSGSISEQI